MDNDRDFEKAVPLPEFIAQLRRLADALEAGESFEIEVEGETIVLPLDAVASIEHEREDGSEEIEFQLKWGASEDEDEDGEASDEDDGDDMDDEDEAVASSDGSDKPAGDPVPA